MFDNPGGKLKALAKFYFWLYVVAGAVAGFAFLIAEDGDAIGMALLLALLGGAVGALIGWLNGLVLYLIGDMAEDLALCRRHLYDINESTEKTAAKQEPTVSETASETKPYTAANRWGE